ncbi:MAG: hypothetical protein ACRDMX_01315 [Solirubrobacteraceae bacterium]
MSLQTLRAALAAEGGTIAAALAPAPEAGNGAGRAPAQPQPPGPPQLAASGPRAAERRAEYELLLEMILEGSLLHYGSPRVMRCDDPALALLLGDRLYALGLERLAAIGDMDAVAELADLISLLAQAQAAGDEPLAAAIWEAGAAAIGWGGGWQHEQAKTLARSGDGRAREALQAFRDAAVGAASDARASDGGRLTAASE